MRETETSAPSFIALAEVDTSLSCDVGLVTDGADNPLSDRGYLNIGECEITLEGDDAARIGEAVAELWNGYRAGHLIDPTAMAEAVASAQAEGWQPIETAPKDGSEFLAWPMVTVDGPITTKAHWYVHPCVEGWVTDEMDCNDYEFTPTHWMPLPAPPTLIPGGSSDV